METRFEYSLPADVLQVRDGRISYTLTLQKQPGTHATPVRIELRLPDSASVVHSTPKPESQTDSTLAYTLALEQDQTLQIILSERSTSP